MSTHYQWVSLLYNQIWALRSQKCCFCNGICRFKNLWLSFVSKIIFLYIDILRTISINHFNDNDDLFSNILRPLIYLAAMIQAAWSLNSHGNLYSLKYCCLSAKARYVLPDFIDEFWKQKNLWELGVSPSILGNSTSPSTIQGYISPSIYPMENRKISICVQ